MAEPCLVAELEGHCLRLRAEPLSETEASDLWHETVLVVAPDYEKSRAQDGPPFPDLPLGPGLTGGQ